MTNKEVLSFGAFRLLLPQRQLTYHGAHVRLGSRSLEILVALLEQPGKLVMKETLMRRVWPNMHVEENALRVHIAGLRKALRIRDADKELRYVENVSGHGYRFVAPVLRHAFHHEATHQSKPVGRCAPSLPVPLKCMIGRSEVVAMVASQLPSRRFVSLVGPGGSGKTTVAVAIANEVCPSYSHGVEFVDLAGTQDAAQVMQAIARQLGVSDTSPEGMSALLEHKHMLVVLDNCEHVVEAAAIAAETLLRGAANLHVLATSRESLRAAGEWVQQLKPLETPPPGMRLSVDAALEYPAVRLFDLRMRTAQESWRLLEEDVPLVAEVCRRLDGLPLAIELAAAQVPIFGLRALIGSQDQSPALLTSGHRTAAARHQTLSATLEWSFATLSATELVVLNRLAAFSQAFDAADAIQAAAADGIGECEVIHALGRFAAKSLLLADVSGEQASYRLLNTVRAVARANIEPASHLATTPTEQFPDMPMSGGAQPRPHSSAYKARLNDS